MEITIMTIQDLNSISDNFQDEFDNFWNYNIFKRELESKYSKYFVCKENSKIVGFAGFLVIADIANLNYIVTKKTHRNKGIATMLMQKILDECNKLDFLTEITLEVNEKNIPAINLYEKFGFEKVGLRKKYYFNKENALLMTKYYQ